MGAARVGAVLNRSFTFTAAFAELGRVLDDRWVAGGGVVGWVMDFSVV